MAHLIYKILASSFKHNLYLVTQIGFYFTAYYSSHKNATIQREITKSIHNKNATLI